MRRIILLSLFVFLAIGSGAYAENSLTLVYSGNSFGEYQPCPS